MHVTWGTEKERAARLRRGLARLGPGFVASICWWCDGLTIRNGESCSVCGQGRIYGLSLGLLIGRQPAPESVVNQVLIAADQSEDQMRYDAKMEEAKVRYQASRESTPVADKRTPMERSTGNRKYLREEDCEDNDEGA